MRLSMTLPTMAGGIDRALLRAWCQAVDEGPFHALAVGERIGFDNLEMHTTLTFAAAATERVRLASTLTIMPMYATAWAAKSLATLDVVSGGRLDLVVGVGGRRHDYDRAERSFAGRHQRLDDQVAELRRIWAGGDVDGVPVGPAPVQSGGPPIFASAMGPKSTARAARWADGNMGFSLAPDTDDHETSIRTMVDAWAAAGRAERPYVSTSFWYSLGDGAAAELDGYARRYLGIFGDEAAAMMASMCSAAGAEATLAGIDRCRAAGMDELYLVPTSSDPDHLSELIDLIT
jgi:alkanesulfonate monooxygenase SsuD/methylene tetrahydromethanopterin reductase-like flavin-dependent oxidoreductase (luciferase family)